MSPKRSNGRGSEGNTKRQKVDDNESLQLLFDKARQLKNISLIEEEFDETENKNEISFKKVKEKLQSSKYSNKQKLVIDLSKVAARAKKSFISWQIFDAASELESFVDAQAETFRTKANLPHRQYIQSKEFASVLLQLNLDEKARSIRLDANRSLIEEQKSLFNDKTDMFQQAALLLSWPLPGISGGNETVGANFSQEFSTHKKIFDIQNASFEVGYLSLGPLLPFNINITENNQIDEDKFTDMYVKPFLDEGYLKKENFIEHFTDKAQRFKHCRSESELEMQLLRCVYDVVEPFIFKGLEDKKITITGQMKDFIKNRSYIKPLKDSVLELNSHFSQLKFEIPFLGTKTIPDLQIGFLADDTVVFLSGMGEVKYISLDLKSNVEELIRLSKKNTGKTPRSGLKSNLKELTGNLKTLAETIAKYASICSILGTTRFVVSDFSSFLFIKLKVRKKADLQGLEEIDTGADELREEPEIEATFSCFSLMDPGIRLKFASFFCLNDGYLNELNEFAEDISKIAEQKIK